MYDCRSEPAREEPEAASGFQAYRVIVDDHRERARSYKPGMHCAVTGAPNHRIMRHLFSAALPCGLSDTFACLAALA
ncbi:hypothetical protein EMIT0P74_40032 [Pseudomonas sp. IT-P74]